MIIIVSGLPGSGKTFLASRLSHEAGADFINSDEVRKEMAEDGQYPFDDEMNVYEAMVRRAATSLRGGKNVVVDATFYRVEMRTMFLALARLLYHKVAYIRVVADDEFIRQRFIKFGGAGAVGLSVYEQLKPQFEEVQDSHLILESRNDNIAEMLSLAKQYIGAIQCEGQLSCSLCSEEEEERGNLLTGRR